MPFFSFSLALLAACAPADEGNCRAWCEFTIAQVQGEETIEAICADVPDVVDGCGQCLDTWGEAAVREASVSPTCCVLGAGSLAPQETCQVEDPEWEESQATYEEQCRTEGAEYGYEYCVD